MQSAFKFAASSADIILSFTEFLTYASIAITNTNINNINLKIVRMIFIHDHFLI
jgi:hypothetical protein